MKSSKSLSGLNQKYRGKPKKYAEGGRVRRPAAAPVASPFDADYIERLAAQAVGAGEPVTELRSAEGRGFAPMPRSFGEAGQRMSAVIRGDVEPTPEEERQMNVVRGFTEGPAAIRAFHASPHRFERFDQEKFGSETDPGALGRAAYFSTDPKVGGADRIHRYEADLDINNPLNLPFPSWFTRKVDIVSNALGLNAPQNLEDWRDWAKTVTQIARERGHDAIVLDYSPVKYNQREIAVFDPEKINILRRYAEGGLAALDEKYADGGTVRAPKETTIAGQDHKLAYITDREAALLKARGGSGRMTDYGVRAYDEGPGGEGPGGDPSDNANSMSESATQDAVGGNQGQGAGPTGAGAGSGPPGGPDSNPNEDAGTETSVTAPTTAPTTGAFGQFGAATGLGVVGGLASFGIGAPGLGTAAAGFGAALDAAKANEQLGMMGLNQTVDRDSAVTNAVSMGAFGQSVANQFGQALGFDALAEAPMSAFSTPDPLGDIAASQMDSGGSQYEQTEYGTPGLSNIATSMAPATAASLVDWNQIQREASALNMSVSDYLAMKWRSPATMARGGMASLQQMHAKYAEGGDVRAPAGEVAEYNPEEIDRIARQIHLRFPEEDLIRPGYEDVESPSDLTMRARLMMRGQNVGLPETVGMGGGNDMFSSSTSMRDIPIESEPYGTSQRMLNTNINAVLDAERNARIGAGMLALERSGERGFTGYGPQLSAGYGPASIYGGYQAITPNIPGAKSQGSYVYGGSLNIPIDDSGTEANIGGSVMSGRRNASNTQIMGSLERPLLGGRLALELAADPSLRHKEILLGYRRAF